jgi:hypothetical protein
MEVIRAIIGGVLLLLGRELNFFFAAAMAALIGLRLTPLLPAQWPAWSAYIFILGVALVAAAVSIRNEKVGYFLSGFLVGGYFLVEYYEPGVLTLPLLPFLVGGAIGSILIGIFTQWALMIVSCLVGAYFLTGLFNLSAMAELLVGGGLVVIGALTQVIMMQMQKGGNEEI